MTVGPLRRLTASIGLLALVPITWLLATGALTAEEAAVRALAVAVVTVALGRALGAVTNRLLQRLERRGSDSQEGGTTSPNPAVSLGPPGAQDDSDGGTG